jgi:SAM-dependent methyltransferase
VADRVYGARQPIDSQTVARFFEDRAARSAGQHPAVTMLYQDSNPALAIERDAVEKSVIVPLLELKATDRALDLGCGIGRWADIFKCAVGAYHGIDPSAALIDIARARLKDEARVSFQVLSAEEASAERLDMPGPFDVILLTGVLHYMNDDACLAAVRRAGASSGTGARLLIRCPIGISQRLTLNEIWSEELKHVYSAIYRTADEYRGMFEQALRPGRFDLVHDAPLYPPSLNNRAETQQHVFMLKKT